MVLAKEAVDQTGRILLAAGCVLDEKALSIFKKWGVLEAEVIGAAQTTDNDRTMPPEVLRQAENAVGVMFRHNTQDNDGIRELIRLCVLREARNIIENRPRPLPAPPTHPDTAPPVRTKSIDPYPLVDKEIKLGTLPDIFNQLVEVIGDPRSSASDIAGVISKDTGLSARLLKIANSAFLGFSQRIDTISRAVIMVGSKQLSALALAVSVISMFRNIPAELVSMRNFWEHSIACGIFARLLAGYKGIDVTERLFVTGIMHDIGHLVIYKYLPEESLAVLKTAQDTGLPLQRCEQLMLGFDHARIGGLLLKKWRMPPILEAPVWHHHEPMRAPAFIQEACLTNIANIMAYALGYGTSGEIVVPRLDKSVWNCLGLSPAVLAPVIGQAELQIRGIADSLFNDEIT